MAPSRVEHQAVIDSIEQLKNSSVQTKQVYQQLDACILMLHRGYDVRESDNNWFSYRLQHKLHLMAQFTMQSSSYLAINRVLRENGIRITYNSQQRQSLGRVWWVARTTAADDEAAEADAIGTVTEAVEVAAAAAAASTTISSAIGHKRKIDATAASSSTNIETFIAVSQPAVMATEAVAVAAAATSAKTVSAELTAVVTAKSITATVAATVTKAVTLSDLHLHACINSSNNPSAAAVVTAVTIIPSFRQQWCIAGTPIATLISKAIATAAATTTASTLPLIVIIDCGSSNDEVAGLQLLNSTMMCISDGNSSSNAQVLIESYSREQMLLLLIAANRFQSARCLQLAVHFFTHGNVVSSSSSLGGSNFDQLLSLPAAVVSLIASLKHAQHKVFQQLNSNWQHSWHQQIFLRLPLVQFLMGLNHNSNSNSDGSNDGSGSSSNGWSGCTENTVFAAAFRLMLAATQTSTVTSIATTITSTSATKSTESLPRGLDCCEFELLLQCVRWPTMTSEYLQHVASHRLRSLLPFVSHNSSKNRSENSSSSKAAAMHDAAMCQQRLQSLTSDVLRTATTYHCSNASTRKLIVSEYNNSNNRSSDRSSGIDSCAQYTPRSAGVPNSSSIILTSITMPDNTINNSSWMAASDGSNSQLWVNGFLFSVKARVVTITEPTTIATAATDNRNGSSDAASESSVGKSSSHIIVTATFLPSQSGVQISNKTCVIEALITYDCFENSRRGGSSSGADQGTVDTVVAVTDAANTASATSIDSADAKSDTQSCSVTLKACFSIARQSREHKIELAATAIGGVSVSSVATTRHS